VHDSRLATILGADPFPWLLDSAEPYAVWATLVDVEGRDRDDPEVLASTRAVAEDERVAWLVAQLPPWREEGAEHHGSSYLPDALTLLADMGVGASGLPAVEDRLAELLASTDDRGRFVAPGRADARDGSDRRVAACDNNAVVDVLLRFGRREDERVGRAVAAMRDALAATPQGRGWRCEPDRRGLLRRPTRGTDTCPQITLEGLRAFSRLPEEERPDTILDAARTPLELWRRRTRERPYDFGHGYQFMRARWPNAWYDVLLVLDTVGRYPALWTGNDAAEDDRTSIAELAACLVAYNFDGEGRVVPARTTAGFERFSFGQKREPSPFATARALAALARVADLAEEVVAVDVEALPVSARRGEAEPTTRRPQPPCPAPAVPDAFERERVEPRVLARHHLSTHWHPESLGSVVADVVGLVAPEPATPYLSMRARLPGFQPAMLDAALYERRSLVRVRCMRGRVYLVRLAMLPVVFTASNDQVVRYARTFAEYRGITAEVYERWAPRVVDALRSGPATTAEIRERIEPEVDVAALVTLLTAEGVLLRDRPVGGWLDRRSTYVVLEDVLPGIRPHGLPPETAALELTREYVRAFGPVTARDAAWWTGLGPKRTERALDSLGDEIVPVSIAGVESDYLMHAADLEELVWTGTPRSPSVAMLPALDPLLSGYARHAWFVDDRARSAVFDRNGNPTSVVLLDGSTVGVWDVLSEPDPTIVVSVFGDHAKGARAAIEQEAVGLGRFLLGEGVRVSWRR
jgi:hypothetical protein